LAAVSSSRLRVGRVSSAQEVADASIFIADTGTSPTQHRRRHSTDARPGMPTRATGSLHQVGVVTRSGVIVTGEIDSPPPQLRASLHSLQGVVLVDLQGVSFSTRQASVFSRSPTLCVAGGGDLRFGSPQIMSGGLGITGFDSEIVDER